MVTEVRLSKNKAPLCRRLAAGGRKPAGGHQPRRVTRYGVVGQQPSVAGCSASRSSMGNRSIARSAEAVALIKGPQGTVSRRHRPQRRPTRSGRQSPSRSAAPITTGTRVSALASFANVAGVTGWPRRARDTPSASLRRAPPTRAQSGRALPSRGRGDRGERGSPWVGHRVRAGAPVRETLASYRGRKHTQSRTIIP